MYSVIQEEPLQKDRPGAASYLQMGSGEEAPDPGRGRITGSSCKSRAADS